MVTLTLNLTRKPKIAFSMGRLVKCPQITVRISGPHKASNTHTHTHAHAQTHTHRSLKPHSVCKIPVIGIDEIITVLFLSQTMLVLVSCVAFITCHAPSPDTVYWP